MNRRNFLKTAAGAALAGAALAGGHDRPALGARPKSGRQLAKKLPRWHGFNLQEKFNAGHNRPFAESDFAWMKQWGFDFVRLPWTTAAGPIRTTPTHSRRRS